MLRQRNVSEILKQTRIAVLQRTEDRDFAGHEDHNVIYAIDSNIVDLYTDPGERSVDRGDRLGYCQFFDNSDKTITESLGRALGHYLFRELSPDLPLVIFDAHLREVDDYIARIAADALEMANGEDAADSRSVEMLVSFFAEHGDSLDAESTDETRDAAKEIIISSLPGLVSKLGMMDKIGRLESLFSASTPAVIAIPALLGGKIAPDWFNPEEFRAPRSIFDRVRFGDARLQIENELKNHKQSAGKKKDAFDNDVDVLAGVYWVNRLMLEKGGKHRLVLITGDENLVKASEAIDAVSPEAFDELPLPFSQCFIRHPKAFVLDDQFIGNFQYDLENLARVSELLRGTELRVQDLEDVENIGEILRMFTAYEDNGDGDIESLVTQDDLAKWADSTIQAQLANYIYKNEAPSRQIFGEHFEEIRRSNDISRTVREIVNQANEKLIDKANLLGLSTIGPVSESLSDQHGVGYRLVPYLRFGDWDPANKVARAFADRKFSIRKIETLFSRLDKQDPSGYSGLLCFALQWAYRDRWDIAEDNAGRALKIALEMDEETSRKAAVYGHEAAYMLEVAKRYLVDDLSGIDELHGYLQIAKRRWKLAQAAEEESRKESEDDELRFRNSDASILLTETLFRVFDEEDQIDRAAIVDDLDQLASTLTSIIESSRTWLDQRHSEDSQRMRRWVRAQCLHKLFTVFLLAKKLDALGSVIERAGEPGSFLEQYATLKMVDENDLFANAPFIHAVTFLTARLCFTDWGSRKTEFKAAKTMVLRALNEENVALHSRKRYDEARYEYLASVAADAQI